MSTKTQIHRSEIIHSSFAFLYNFPPNFIETGWPKAVNRVFHTHLLYKYLDACKAEGYASPTAILKFYAQLDADNQAIFLSTMSKLMK